MKVKKMANKIICFVLIILIIGLDCGCKINVSNDDNIDYNIDYSNNMMHYINIGGSEEVSKLKEDVYDCKIISDYGKNKQVDEMDTIKFGKYEQDGNLENGKEDIEWIILKKNDGKILLISKYILDNIEYHSYNIPKDGLSWKNSDIFYWLNWEFISNAFSIEECRRILPAEEGGLNGNDVYEKVFLLDEELCVKYFGKENEDGYNYRLATRATKYAINNKNTYNGEQEYLIFDSDIRKITKDDIVGFDDKKIRMAINEIYARHGRGFKDSQIQEYFSSKKWYKRLYDADNFDESKFSDIEWANIDFLNNEFINNDTNYDISETNTNNGKWYSNNDSFWIMDAGGKKQKDESIKEDDAKAAYVDETGKKCKEGKGVKGKCGIRPMIWVDIENPYLNYRVMMGKYEQDGNLENGKEDIEWIVLDSQFDKNGNERLLLLSKYLIESKPYNDVTANVTWKESTLHKWLNNDFYNESFDEYEKKHIINTEVVDEVGQPPYSPKETFKTNDNIFILDINEIEKYFGSMLIMQDKAKSCKYTDYAIDIAHKYQRYNTVSDKDAWYYDNGDYWLREAYSGKQTVDVKGGDDIEFFATAAVANTGWSFLYDLPNNEVAGVRPAMWVYKEVKK